MYLRLYCVILHIKKDICGDRCLSRKVSYSKSGYSQALVKCPKGHRQACMQTGLAFLFLLVLPIYVGKQRYQQSSERYQQSQYSQKNHNSFIICHQRHILRSAPVRAEQMSTGHLAPHRWAFPYENFIISHV